MTLSNSKMMSHSVPYQPLTSFKTRFTASSRIITQKTIIRSKTMMMTSMAVESMEKRI